jgi:AMP-polyphosphate phosphotransferase
MLALRAAAASSSRWHAVVEAARMFESAEIGAAVDKATWEREAPKVREALLQAQRRFASAGQSLVVIVGGVEGAGKSETVNLLLEWMDARGVAVRTFSEPREDQGDRPEYWKFWQALPPKGRIGIFLGSWYSRPIVQSVFGELGKGELDVALDRIVEFERMLSQEKVTVVKFWMHLSKKVQKKRLRELEADKLTAWRVTKADWKFFKRYDTFREVSEHALRRTDTAEAPWHIVEAADSHHRALKVTRTLVEVLEEKVREHGKAMAEKAAAAAAARTGAAKGKQHRPALPVPKKVNLLSQLDLTRTVEDKEYEKKILKAQGKLALLTRELARQGRSAILVFEGPDAAGKGGAIRRLTQAIDARLYEVKSVSAPTDEERAHPYLWRFWRALPRVGRVTIYDRSWYGRVLVERLEGFASTADWQRAFNEINAFEEQLVESGVVVVKFWLAISADEQLRRFKDREVTPYKQYKITEEDWRNRDKWDAYVAAACDMFEKTSTELAPWTLVEANDKKWARLKVLRTVVERLEGA